MQKNICLSLYDPKYLCSPFQQTTCLFFPLSDFWLLGEVQWSALLLSSSKTEKCIEVKRGAKHSVGHESQLVSNMSTLFPLFLWNLLFLLMVFLSSWSLETIQTVEKKKKRGKKLCCLRVHSEEQKKEGETFRLIHGATLVAMHSSMNGLSQLLLNLGDWYLLVFTRARKACKKSS